MGLRELFIECQNKNIPLYIGFLYDGERSIGYKASISTTEIVEWASTDLAKGHTLKIELFS